jgi:hypothetical protein
MQETIGSSAIGRKTTPTLNGSAIEPQPLSAARLARKALTPLASLRLTVVLFALSLLLVFLGTLALIDEGLWTVLHKHFRGWIAWIPLRVFVRFGQIFLGVSKTAELSGAFPFPGGKLLGSMLLANLLAAHAVRFKVNWKRSGILLIHSGLIVMMLGEGVTSEYAVETRMTIKVNGSSNYVAHHQDTELAIIDSSDPKQDDVVVVPEAMLRKGAVPRHELLPFDVQPLRFMANSDLVKQPPSGTTNPATAGDGLHLVAVEQPEVPGADAEQREDVASAYVTFTDKENGRTLGTFLVSRWFTLRPDMPSHAQHVSVNGKQYDVYLRYKRIYKPYTVQLLEFHHDKYMGTNIPKNYSSVVRLTDPAQNEKREVVISMNQPLRYGGETFYQSGVLPDDSGTILQVVRNPGWLMPYISCGLVAVGMIVHFGLNLVGFLRRKGVR